MASNELDNDAIPSINDPVLGRPEAVVKSQTNVSKLLGYFGIALGVMCLVGGTLYWVSNRSNNEPELLAGNPPPPSYDVINKEVSSETIMRKQQRLLEEQAAKDIEAARAKALEEKRLEAERLQAEQERLQAQAEADAQAAAEYAAALEAARLAAEQRNAYNANTGEEQPRPMTPRERKMTGSVLFDLGAVASSQSNEAESQVAQVQPVAANGLIDDPLFQPTIFPARYAGRLSDLDYLLKLGTTIPCVTKTGIDTTLPGLVICQVVSDVYSANGKTLLVERGAMVFGEQRSALKQGQARTFVLWTRIDNPSGVTLNIDSPAADQMGVTGIAGFVDTHFWDRFGGAILISLISDFSATIQAKSQETGDNSTTYNNTTNTGEDLATETLKNSINIPPTLIVNPATLVNVVVARDISFQNVYRLLE
jgi:type IV secretion system protein VirB10